MKTLKGKDKSLDRSRRKVVKLAYTMPALIGLGMLVPTESEAKRHGRGGRHHGSCSSIRRHCNNGWGNGDQGAPGKSYWHNNAENGPKSYTRNKCDWKK